jgi:hypothetical protein
LDEETRRELQNNKLCFSCQEPWASGHICVGKEILGKAHYIEVYSDSENDEDEEVEHAQDQGCNDPKPLCKDHHGFGVFLKLFVVVVFRQTLCGSTF